nr:immunoglobulin light chain junction region [Macaca mulatta]MOX24482.1 immunoglobulin light chain junction region [Macaca mulatta]MOX24917.1 immunoglobulin light chain junction region [Macaca mulatta]MOX24943.1 immunoglobulin light chain junction region [Macaca mulatta]MOX25243.1 immunoglobulin light chain junction region [Macaca mulatta]
CQQAYNTPYSF